MPFYAYCCKNCGVSHEEFRSMSEPEPKKCPYCGQKAGDLFHKDYQASCVQGLNKGNPTTFGQQAELNARKAGKEQMQKMAEKDRLRLRTGWTGPVAEGGTLPELKPEIIPPWRDGSMGTEKLDKPLDLSKISDLGRYIETGNK